MTTVARLAGMQDVPNPSTSAQYTDSESQVHVVPARPSRATVPLDRRRSLRSLQTTSSRNSLQAAQDDTIPPVPSLPGNITHAGGGGQGIAPQHITQQPLYTATRRDTTPTAQEADDGLEWGPSHPCFPHPNPHVAKDRPEFTTTRVIRVARDFLTAGDLYPQFQNVYPEILIEYISEDEFRTLIDELNRRLKAGFEPSGARAVVDALMGTFTGFLWDDVGATETKSAVRDVEKWMDEWNTTRAKEGRETKLIPLRRTGFMNLDIQIPDPGLDVDVSAESENEQ